MNQLEYEIERDNISLSYAKKLNELNNDIRNMRERKNDLQMQMSEINKEMINWIKCDNIFLEILLYSIDCFFLF